MFTQAAACLPDVTLYGLESDKELVTFYNNYDHH